MADRRAAVIVLATALPAFAASGQTTVDHINLPPCPQPAYYLRALDIEKQATAEMSAAHWPEANRLLNLALITLGTRYDPYHRSLDDSQELLQTAALLEKGGHLETAVRNKKFVLDNRLGMQIEPMYCNKVVSRIR